jgi:hypothetical protein
LADLGEIEGCRSTLVDALAFAASIRLLALFDEARLHLGDHADQHGNKMMYFSVKEKRTAPEA